MLTLFLQGLHPLITVFSIVNGFVQYMAVCTTLNSEPPRGTIPSVFSAIP